ncbi:hypothetical protein MRX96_042485 [Rhipicephalus microplus]
MIPLTYVWAADERLSDVIVRGRSSVHNFLLVAQGNVTPRGRKEGARTRPHGAKMHLDSRNRPTARFREGVSAQPLNHYRHYTTREAVRRQRSNNNWGRKEPRSDEKLGRRASLSGVPLPTKDARQVRLARTTPSSSWRPSFLSALPRPGGAREPSGPRPARADAYNSGNAEHTTTHGGYVCCVVNLERWK